MEELMLLEIRMSQTNYDSGMIYEGVAEGISNAYTKLCAMLKKIIIEMSSFLKQLQITVESTAFTIKMKHALSKVEKDLKAGKGGPVSIVDMATITKLYQKDIAKLRKDIQGIGSDLRKLSVRSGAGKINRYMSNKNKMQEEIEEMLTELELATQKRVIVKPEMAKKEIDNIIRTQQLYMADYSRVIYDFERLVVEFSRATTIAETDYAVREAVKDYSSPIHQIKVGATKLLRKSVFAVVAVTGVVV